MGMRTRLRTVPIASVLLAGLAEAAEFPCTETGIRDAVAAGGGPHTFACPAATTVVAAAEIALPIDVVLDGGGLLTVSGGQAHRVFGVEAGAVAELQNLVVANGSHPSFSINGFGILNRGDLTLRGVRVTGGRGFGAIFNASDATLVREGSQITGNQYGQGFPAIWGGQRVVLIESRVAGNAISAGISGSNELLLVDSQVNGDQGEGLAAGVAVQHLTAVRSSISGFSFYGTGGLHVPSGGSAELIDSKVSGHSANGAIGGISNSGDLYLLRTRISDSGAYIGPGALANHSGARARIVDSEIVRNGAAFGAPLPSAISNSGELEIRGCLFDRNYFATLVNSGHVSIVNTTIVGSSFAGLEFSAAASGEITHSTLVGNGFGHRFTPGALLENSIVLDNCDGTASSAGGNIGSAPASGPPSCGLGAGDVTGVAPAAVALGPLVDNGGPTRTHELLPGSIALDAAPACAADTDQRGVPRPQGPACDVGAFEAGVIAARIDVRPRSIRLSRPGLLPVAVYGSEELDIGAIDLATLAFGPGPARPANGVGDPLDLDGDGRADLLLRYRVVELDLELGESELCLSGETLEGLPLYGCDEIRVVPPAPRRTPRAMPAR